MFFVLMAFVFGFLVLYGSDPEKGWSASSRAIIRVFQMMIGAADHPTWFEAEDMATTFPMDPIGTMGTLYFVGFNFLVTIVLLNLLIAIMSNSYERVAEKAEIELIRARAQQLVDLETLFVKTGKKKNPIRKWIRKFLCCCCISKVGENEEPEEADLYDEAFPKVLHILYQLDDYNLEVVDQLDKVDDDDAFQALRDQIGDLNRNLIEAIASSQRETNEKIARLENIIGSVLKLEEKNKILLMNETEERKKEIEMFEKAQKKATLERRRTQLQLGVLNVMKSSNGKSKTPDFTPVPRPSTVSPQALKTMSKKASSPALLKKRSQHDQWSKMFKSKMSEIDQQIENQKVKVKKVQSGIPQL